MPIARWLLATLLFSGSAHAAGPVPQDLYVRGGFNGWGTDNPLVYKGNGVYEAQITISPGNHGFKVGSGDWSAEWVIERSTSVAADTSYAMATRPGPENTLFVRQSAPYRFSVDVSDRAAPVIRITRLPLPAAAAEDPHQGHRQSASMVFPTHDGKTETVRFSALDPAAALRSYAQSTTLQLRDPGPQHTTYQESAALPAVRSGSLAFDALFALAAAEMRLNAVSQIKDGNYNGGAPIDCACFETGEKWHYVWTRDLSYAAHLGLAMLDPDRVRNSLEFKLSGWRSGVPRAPQVAGSADGLQIIQDTGSGGSWPVSTDRVSWAFGAEAALNNLDPAKRRAFAPVALKALINTLENDRIAAFDRGTGLYTGEQSFLDWREQSYASWIVGDIASMASAKALSTNVAHYKALTLAARLAREQGQRARAARYAGWADELKRAINARLWLADAGMYSSLTAGHFDGAPLHKFDWLGQSLAIVTGVADPARARSILARYPHGPMGAPVIYPQQMDVPVYHNRAIWPFVTAYGLKAAAQAGNVAVADAAYATLMRGAAVNLSNMENLEWLSGQPLLLDENKPSLIGPVINSRRQLWSVGAYLGMVIENVFGIASGQGGLQVRPFITARLRRDTFGAATAITLQRLRLHGKQLTVTVRLPAASGADGYYAVDSITLNGRKAGSSIAWQSLADDNQLEIVLGSLQAGDRALRSVSADPYQEDSKVFGPREPAIAAQAGSVRIDGQQEGVAFNIYRNGRLAASGLQAGTWRDPDGAGSACYAAEALFTGSGNRSHHSAPACVGPAIEQAAPFKDWGKPDQRFVSAVQVGTPGSYQIQLRYHNRANQINLGISGGVKWLAVKDNRGRTVAQGVVQLPHARLDQGKAPPVYSTPLAANLATGSYRIEMSDFYNMSYLQSNSSFSAAGGTNGPSNQFDIHGVRLLRVR